MPRQLPNFDAEIHSESFEMIDSMVADQPLNTVCFESLSHTNTVLTGLNELRKREYLLDVTLLAEGRSFKVRIR